MRDLNYFMSQSLVLPTDCCRIKFETDNVDMKTFESESEQHV